MTTEINSYIKTIVHRLEFLVLPVVERIQAPLSYSTIDDMTGDTPFKLSAELRDLYNSANGTRVKVGDPLDELYWVPGYYVLSLEDALTMYHAFKSDYRWSKNWFPVLASGGGDFIVQEQSVQGSSIGKMWNFMVGEPEYWDEAVSLGSWLGMTEECFNRHIYYVDDMGCLECDWDKQAEVRMKWNPEQK